jgi:hypothetical protein
MTMTAHLNGVVYARRQAPKPRSRIYDIFWQFAAERQAVFDRRVRGAQPPWTDDHILQQFKFCNVYRAADRVSQFLIREVIYSDEHASPADLLFQIVAFRTFSRIETWRSVRTYLQRSPTLHDLRDGAFEAALNWAKAENGGLYTGAFILCANNAYGTSSKHSNHTRLFKHMFLDNCLAEQLLNAKSMQEVYGLLHDYPLMGDFMSYQTAVDLNYSALLGFSENEFTKPGPGALRGIAKVFEDLGEYSLEDVIHWMVDRQGAEFDRLGIPFNGLWGRPIQAIDCQGLFCEVDKYCRVAAPELRSARTRIKAKFAAKCDGFVLYFPPKWGINEYLPMTPVFGPSGAEDPVQYSLFENVGTRVETKSPRLTV